MFSVVENIMPLLWFLLVALRLGWSVLPQSGYIHPDEFFQSVEVIAGDALNISVVSTWEFLPDFPLRSIVLPQVLFFPVFKLLAFLDQFSFLQLSGYTQVAGYRLAMAVLSLWIDVCVYRICCILGIPSRASALLLASSYVTLTFQTHTFSNSQETLLFSTLILLILEHIKTDMEENDRMMVHTSKEITGKDESRGKEDQIDLDSSFDNLHKMAFNLRKRSKSKTENSETEQHLRVTSSEETGTTALSCQKSKKCFRKDVNIVLIAAVISIGVFNRPTFILFSLLPCIWWLDMCFTGSKPTARPALLFTTSGLLSSLIISLFDTIYFKDVPLLSLLSVSGLKNVLQDWVITPLNFALYNISPHNLQSHGLHPFYLHLLINMPMLFGPVLYPLTKENCFKLLKFVGLGLLNKDKCSEDTNLSHANNSMSLRDKLRKKFSKSVCFLIFLPVVLFSFFPHQEARFLIPLLPLVILSSALLSNNLGKFLLAMHIIFNAFFCIVFGVLHQGGVIPCLFHLQQMNSDRYLHDSDMSVKVIFSHTYMPPKHILMTRSSNLELLDLKGSSLDVVCETVKNGTSENMFNIADKNFKSSKNRAKILLALPGSLVSEFNEKCELPGTVESWKFFPHLSFEDPPDFSSIDSANSLYSLLSLHLLELV